MSLDVTLIAPDGSATVTFKAETISMTIVRTPIATETASNFMVTVDIGKQRRQFTIDGMITTDATLGTAKTQIEALENAFINWWSLSGNGGDTANPPTGGPSGTIGRAVLTWGTKNAGTVKRYVVALVQILVVDSPMDYGADANKFRFSMTLIEAGNGSNNLSTSG